MNDEQCQHDTINQSTPVSVNCQKKYKKAPVLSKHFSKYLIYKLFIKNTYLLLICAPIRYRINTIMSDKTAAVNAKNTCGL